MSQFFVRLFSSLVLAIAVAAPSAAQCLPIELQDARHWEIHDQNGPMGLEIEVFEADDGSLDLFTFDASGHITGWSWAILLGNGSYEMHNGDSGNVTTWQWQCGDGDGEGHYLKIGGTHHHREFHPVF